MMMGVAHVMGMNPTFRSFFSIAPPCANTSAANFSGKNWESAASAVEAPTALRKARRARFFGNIARITADATRPFIALFVTRGWCAEKPLLALVLGVIEVAPAHATA